MNKPKKPRFRLYDNRGKTLDRFTCVIVDPAWSNMAAKGYVPSIGFREDPNSPQGFSQFGDCLEGPHLGRRIKWTDLTEDLQKHLMGRLK